MCSQLKCYLISTILLICHTYAATFYCPTGETFTSSISDNVIWNAALEDCQHPCNWNWDHEWLSNGCSGGIIGDLFQEWSGFEDVCNIHDLCYRLHSNKDDCDVMMYANMMTACEGGFFCELAVPSAYASVQINGQSSYDEARLDYAEFCSSDSQCIFGLSGGDYCCHPHCSQCGGSGCGSAHDNVFDAWNSKSDSQNCCNSGITRSCSSNVAPCVGITNDAGCIVDLYAENNFGGNVWGPYLPGDYTLNDLISSGGLQFDFQNDQAHGIRVKVSGGTTCKVALYLHDNFVSNIFGFSAANGGSESRVYEKSWNSASGVSSMKILAY